MPPGATFQTRKLGAHPAAHARMRHLSQSIAYNAMMAFDELGLQLVTVSVALVSAFSGTWGGTLKKHVGDGFQSQRLCFPFMCISRKSSEPFFVQPYGHDTISHLCISAPELCEVISTENH